MEEPGVARSDPGKDDRDDSMRNALAAALLTMTAEAAVTIEKTAWKGWPNCYRVANSTVELIVTADGTVGDVRFLGPLHVRSGPDVARSVRAAIAAADDAARWAREKLHTETFGEYRRLTED